MNKEEFAVETRDLSRSFHGRSVVRRLNLRIRPGEVFGLVGPDGAGKTTTIRLLCGLLKPSGGSARVAGFDVETEDTEIKEFVGYMPQKFGLYTDLTVQENLDFFADLFGLTTQVRRELMGQLLAMTRMKPFIARAAGQLSGGMKQKLGLMCALLHTPKVLFLDEPTNGVDPVSRRDFWVILYELIKKGITIVISTAYLDEAERCNRVAFLHNGNLVACESPHMMIDRIPEKCYAVAVSDQHKARDILGRLPEVLSAEPAGTRLHVFFSPEGLPPERLTSILAEKGAGPVAVDQIKPSMEDIFIALVRKQTAEVS